MDSAGNYLGETTWSTGGGGISQYEAQPSYQNNLVIHAGTAVISAGGLRAGPDVASVADPNTGVAIYGSYGFGGWTQIGGTSAGAPAWAGLMALVDQGRAASGLASLDGFTQTLPALYALPGSDFHDITTGGNGDGYKAGPGFDLVTGRGTPIANLLVPALAGGGISLKPPTIATAIQVSAASTTSVNLSVLGADAGGEANLTYTWSVTGNPPGAVTFTTNGGNGSKKSTAVLSHAGTYTFQVAITNSSGLSVTSQVSYTVSQVLTSIKVSPASSSIAANTTAQFSATGFDQFGVAEVNQPASFAWSLNSGSVGSISAAGVYTAPAGPGTATIQASVGAVRGAAGVTILGQNTTTTTTISSSPVSYYGRDALATITVRVWPSSGSITPTGTVELFYNGSVIGTATVQIVNGVAIAEFSVQFTANGSYAFTAEYLGNSNYLASWSKFLTVLV